MSSRTVSSSTSPWRDIATCAARWILGCLFVYLGWTKAQHPVEFLKVLRQYDVFHHHILLNLIAAALPWFEVFCGMLLVLGVAVRGTTIMIVAMLIPFTAVILNRALAIYEASVIPFCSIQFDCGCGAGEVIICHKLLENLSLMMLSVFILFSRNHRWNLRHALLKES